MVVHPAVGNWSGTFVNALMFHCKDFMHQFTSPRTAAPYAQESCIG